MTIKREDTERDRASTDDPILDATDLRKYFTVETGILERLIGAKTHVKAVDGVDIRINRHETLGLVGESGCGKSTLGRLLARLYEPTSGQIRFDGERIDDISGSQLKETRKRIQVIFQDPMSSLNPRKTVGEIVGKPLKIHGICAGSADRRERVEALFEEVGLQRSHLDRYPHEFSGGQRQRVGIARALAVEPDLIIADEPVSALDVSVQAQIINLLKRLQAEYGLSYLFIAHDLSVIKHIADRVAVMYLGEVVETGPTEAIFHTPQHPYTRALLHSIPNIKGAAGKRRDVILEGSPPSPTDPPAGCPFHTRCPEYIDGECEGVKPELMAVSDAKGVLTPSDASPFGGPDTGMIHENHRVACHWLKRTSKERVSQDPLANGEGNG